MSNKLEILSEIIANRRTTKPQLMNGKLIEEKTILKLLELANWAPTHANTEPWRFIVYTPETKTKFCKAHAALYKLHTDKDKFLLATFQKLEQMGNLASHIIIAYAKSGSNIKIPIVEEVAATSAAIQNFILAAEALNIATYWGTGGMIHQPVFKSFLNLNTDDVVLGTIYLGYTNEKKEGKRITTINEKINWVR
ncbi:MAG TPA: nitroreductase [Chitinophagaceae bacterium]|nr:nitroreductase [Chitinophagaceae bacterium]